MQSYELHQNDVLAGGESIPIIWKGKIAVIGGGISGVMAAAAGARKKIPVLVLEKNSYFGGEAASGGGKPLEGACPGDVSIGGIMDEMLAKLRFAGIDSAQLVQLKDQGLAYYHDSEQYKRLADEFLEKSGCCRLLNALVTDILASDGRVEALLVNCKMQKGAVLADAFVDATGDALAAKYLGIPVAFGEREEIYSYPYILSKTDGKKIEAYRKKDPSFQKALAKAKKNGGEIRDLGLIWNLRTDICTNRAYADSIRISGKEEQKLPSNTETEIKARAMMQEQIQFYREYIPGLEQCRLYRCCDQALSLRGMHIREMPDQGQPFVTGYDSHSNGILRCRAVLGSESAWQEVPFSAMAPAQYENLIVTGKAMAVNDVIQERIGSAGRMAAGQCAGIAAVQIALKGLKNTELNGALLRSMMDEAGCDMDGDKSVIFRSGKTAAAISPDGEAKQ